MTENTTSGQSGNIFNMTHCLSADADYSAYNLPCSMARTELRHNRIMKENGLNFSYWNDKFKSIDRRKDLKTLKKRHHNSLQLFPFRKLFKYIKPFRTDQGDVLFRMEDGSIVGAGIIIK